jgi:hypothetical protein
MCSLWVQDCLGFASGISLAAMFHDWLRLWTKGATAAMMLGKPEPISIFFKTEHNLNTIERINRHIL